MSSHEDDAAVVLLHGLWLNGVSLISLQARVRRCGFSAHRFEYPTVRLGLVESAARLARFVGGLNEPKVHVVAHSLGGLVALRALADHPGLPVRRVVLLGCPVAGSVSGRRLADFHGGHVLLGENTRIWEQRHLHPLPEGVQVGVLAGNRPVGLGQLIGRLPKPHDGTVSVAETQMQTAKDSIVLPVTHTQMIFSGRVAKQVCSFLSHGCFAHSI